MILFFDTETTDLPLFKEPSDDPRQPHLIQFAAILTDDDGNEADRLSTLVKPGAGAVMGQKAFEAHGITLQRASVEGMNGIAVSDWFHSAANEADLIVGHNISFDIRIMRIHAARNTGIKWTPERKTYCTMKASTNIINLPPSPAMRAAGRNHPKSPRLEECVSHFFGEKLDGAHDALVDVTACQRVFFHLKSLGK